MSESRLHHLRRQQALLREHQAWIETEIARESPAGMTDATPPPGPVIATPIPIASSPTGEADALLEKYAADERQNPADVRRGCLIIFFGILGIIGVALTAIWFLRYR